MEWAAGRARRKQRAEVVRLKASLHKALFSRDWQAHREALAEIAARDARIAELERDAYENLIDMMAKLEVAKARIAELEAALRELVDDIGEQLAPVEIAYLQRTYCPECEDEPDEVILLCPLHKAQALLAKYTP